MREGVSAVFDMLSPEACGGQSFACGRFFLLADLLLLGMWIELNRGDQARFLPFDADAGSSSNMASSQPGRPNRVQSWAERSRSKNTIRRGASSFSMEETSDLRIKNMVRVSLALS